MITIKLTRYRVNDDSIYLNELVLVDQSFVLDLVGRKRVKVTYYDVDYLICCASKLELMEVVSVLLNAKKHGFESALRDLSQSQDKLGLFLEIIERINLVLFIVDIGCWLIFRSQWLLFLAAAIAVFHYTTRYLVYRKRWEVLKLQLA